MKIQAAASILGVSEVILPLIPVIRVYFGRHRLYCVHDSPPDLSYMDLPNPSHHLYFCCPHHLAMSSTVQ